MDMTQYENLGRVLRYGAMSAEEQKGFVTVERNRIARILREAKGRAKMNKAANGGVYVPAAGGRRED
jgi:RNase P protein component